MDNATPPRPDKHFDFRNGMQGIPSEKFIVEPAEKTVDENQAVLVPENIPSIPTETHTVTPPKIESPAAQAEIEVPKSEIQLSKTQESTTSPVEQQVAAETVSQPIISSASSEVKTVSGVSLPDGLIGIEERYSKLWENNGKNSLTPATETPVVAPPETAPVEPKKE